MGFSMSTICAGCGRDVKDHEKLDKKGLCKKCQKKEAS